VLQSVLQCVATCRSLCVDLMQCVIQYKNATPPNSTKSKNSKFSVQIQIKSKSQFRFAPQDTEESEFIDLVDFGDVKFPVETVIKIHIRPQFPFEFVVQETGKTEVYPYQHTM